MKNLTFIGRLLFGIPFIFLGLGHFIELDFFTAEFTSFIAIGPYTIMLTGLLLIAAGVSIVTNKLIQVSTLLLAALIFVFILTIHIPNYLNGNETEKAFAMMSMLKDLSLMGGSLIVAGICKERNKVKQEA
ncbi:DoxX family protein [Saccharicrinis sp. FJH2]|uniref:DoxX family protein n=1 Tax=Saccharicrinis sp. FJH65 TaxID=3344659 RepID=UPI0035F29B98